MALEDAIRLGSTTHAYTDTSTSGNISEETAGALGIDGDFTTYHGITASNSGGYGSDATIISEHTFSTAKTISKITYRTAIHGQAAGSYEVVVSVSRYVQYYSGGAWTTVSGSSSTSVGDSGSVTYTFDTPVSCTAIKSYAYFTAWASGGEGSNSGYAKIYEIQAYFSVKKSYAGVV